MAASAKWDDDEGIDEINVTPLVDVMLVLLVIFLVASIYIVKDAIEVEVPKAASAGETLDSTLAIVIDREGRLYLNGRPTPDELFAQACKQASERDSNAQAIIAADQNVKHGDVIRVIDLVRTNGLTRFAINVKPADILDGTPASAAGGG
ncbi:MAG TPA: biopolymer transporter ExbD [Polyangiaceae bacterium]|jgi:biopolymer transport protein ExbD|nr:biopolymer transporter ExbD [Polyangiaceae bacterium]